MIESLNISTLTLQCLNFLLFTSWLVLSLFAIRYLKHRNLSPTDKALYALLALLVPVVGAITVFMISPEASPDQLHR